MLVGTPCDVAVLGACVHNEQDLMLELHIWLLPVKRFLDPKSW